MEKNEVEPLYIYENKSRSEKKKTDQLIFIKIKNFLCFKEHYWKKTEKITHKMGENIRQLYSYLIKNFYLKYVKNTHRSIIDWYLNLKMGKLSK